MDKTREHWVDLDRYLELFSELASQKAPSELARADDAICGYVKLLPSVKNHFLIALVFSGINKLRATQVLIRGGAVTETTPLMRVSLECVLYALAVKCDSKVSNAWENRHSDEDAKKFLRRELGKRSKNILKSQNENVASNYDMLYQKLIDFGAHPNIASIAPLMKYAAANEGPRLDFQQLSSGPERLAIGSLLLKSYFVFGQVLLLIWPDAKGSEKMPDTLNAINTDSDQLMSDCLSQFQKA